MLTITVATKRKDLGWFHLSVTISQKRSSIYHTSDMSCRNRTLNNRGFLWTTVPVVVAAVGTDVDDFQGIEGMVC